MYYDNIFALALFPGEMLSDLYVHVYRFVNNSKY